MAFYQIFYRSVKEVTFGTSSGKLIQDFSLTFA
jgi:hypothetical protein